MGQWFPLYFLLMCSAINSLASAIASNKPTWIVVLDGLFPLFLLWSASYDGYKKGKDEAK